MLGTWRRPPHWLIFWLTCSIIGACLLFLTVYFVIGWIATGRALAVNPQQVQYDQTVEAIDGNSYTISGSAYSINGLVGGIRQDGSRIGSFSAPLSQDEATQTSQRSLEALQGRQPVIGEKISLQGNMWTSNPKEALGLQYSNVQYASQLGPMNAWVVPPPGNDRPSTKWTIGVHGVNADKQELLRFIRPVVATGNTMMFINYRNDPGNPRSGDDYTHLGDTEWQDVEAAVRYAKGQGATEINLYGTSLGASAVLNYLRRSSDAAGTPISHVILDSPAIDWTEISRAQLTRSGYPAYIAHFTKLGFQLRAGINVDRISTRPQDIRHQTLIFHSSDDRTVPPTASKRLAAARPELVSLHDFGKGGHVRSWNNNPSRYEQLVSEFLNRP